MTQRRPDLPRFFDLARQCISARATGDTARAAERVFGRLSGTAGEVREPERKQLAVCDAYLESAIAGAVKRGGLLAELGRSLADLAPLMAWDRRKTSTSANQPFHDGHANATIAGPGGFEERGDVWVGVSLMAPGIVYPVHSHPPEEIYLAMSNGEWWNSEMDWTEPGPGGLVYNTPGILHAMRSGSAPFLALWLLPVD
jgi:quercetin dioxygenase-like cupin family protein